ncbi:hypothetical protein AAEP93_011394 [Penicillium crustosum]
MSSDTTAEKSHIHLEQRKSLITLEATIDALMLHTLDASQLDQLNIKRQSMALEKGSDLKPHFFAPKANLPQPSKKLIRKSVEHLNNKDAFADPMSRYLMPLDSAGDYNSFKHLYKYDKPDFSVFTIMDIPGEQSPHLKAVIYNGLEGEDSTILIVSFLGKSARLLESYFDCESLALRSSDLYELSEQTTTSMVFKGFAGWFLGDPAGKTF